jgi:mono/diheme cytochrome c family protein
MRTRLAFLVMTVSIAVIAVACGRASQTDIDMALGITPTPTFSAAAILTSTAEAGSAAATKQAAIAALASPGGQGANVDLASAGDVTQGRVQFQIRCQQCHQPSGKGAAVALAGPGNAATKYTDAQLRDLVRTGVGHAQPPGPLNTTAISDRQLINIIAFIRSQSK